MLRLSAYRHIYSGLTKPTYQQMIDETDSKLVPLGFIKEEIGLTEDGNFMMYGYRLGDFQKPTMWIDSNIHGSEWWTYCFCLEFFERLGSLNFYDKKAVEVLRETFSWYYIPSVNPWGFENNVYENVNQVNLNRNFDNNWDTYEGTPIGGNSYKGEAVWSEAEASNIRDKFLELLPYFALNCHTTTGDGNGIDTNKRYKWYNILMTDIYKSSKLSVKGAGTLEWATQFSPQASAWYGLQTSKEGKRVISTILEHQSDATFNYGLNTLFIIAFTILNFYKNGKMKLNNLAEIKP
jgi:hypothetical protein